MNTLIVNTVHNYKGYKQYFTEEALALENVENVFGVSEYNRLIGLVSQKKPFFEFKQFYNYAGIIIFNPQTGFGLYLYDFDSTDSVLDLFATFKNLDWTPTERQQFTTIVQTILNSKQSIANIMFIK